MNTKIFDYTLPENLIAQKPITPRENARLMILKRDAKKIEQKNVGDILEYLKKGDVLVLNNTKVFKARLKAKVNNRIHEVFLLKFIGGGRWETLLGKRKKIKINDELNFEKLTARVSDLQKDGVTIIEFDADKNQVLDLCEKSGDVPLPPYIASKEGAGEYQTVYAEHIGSVAAPTAGFHISKNLLGKIIEKGVLVEYVTLHVGLGTFRPVQTDSLDDHKMHSEWVEIKPEVGSRILKAKKEFRRVIAVGTTSVRSLEGAVEKIGLIDGLKNGFAGEVNIFIKPGFEFKVVDGIMTNFHLPKSTLIVLVSSFAGRDFIMQAYKNAVEEKYRFYSFGDAMLIV
ncbi:tRNA preQ1(34) S-adenosylmethionine ribosyltransferase-isomerase QueA [Patescibacteria group bacterium]|nr:tRNA preQ1(34) S-adenosylmethionine ribosyltransferase-isomerase QueA [Patescibacteria group bacterium]